MCSGARSNSANGAIAARAAPASSWSTSSSTVLSDCTISGPSVIQTPYAPLSVQGRHLIRVGGHHCGDAVNRELAGTARTRIKRNELSAGHGDRRHHPLRVHPGGTYVTDQHRCLFPRV